MNTKTLLASIVSSITLCAGSAHAAFIQPVEATASSFYSAPEDNREPSLAIQSDSTLYQDPGTVTNNTASMWMAGDTTPVGEWIAFDLGGVYDLSAIYIWNYYEINGTRGISQATVEVSTDGINWGSPTSGGDQNDIAIATGKPIDLTDTLSISATGVSHVRLTIDATHGDTYGGIADVGFEGTLVPEPGSLAILGLGGLLLRARRRRG